MPLRQPSWALLLKEGAGALRGAVLVGGTSTGKSHLAVAIARN